ncbi:hypothetical protein J2Z60_001281 [Lactobacillus colini]|uniref:Polysaccharide polymerase n=1 Tax=Lactobacillus colini TaxID=1819254 RepID=A0ABS4MEI7_9LACO|nr:hypothetical protein [Lactobacillus colini]MBP2058104.1 hypothetical protein [Lactobacillus colini]
MKLTNLQIEKFLIYLIVIILLFRISAMTMLLSIFIAVILWLLYLYFPKTKKSYNVIIDISVISIILLFFINAFRSLFLGSYTPLTIKGIITNYGGYLLVIIAYPVAELVNSDKSGFLRGINRIGMSFLVLKTLSWVIYNFFNRDIGFTLLGGKITWTRVIGNHIFSRSGGTFLDGFLLAYAIGELFSSEKSKNQNIKYIVQLLVLITYSYLIYQSRAQLIFYFATILINIFCWAFSKKYKFLSSVIACVFILGTAYIFKDKLTGFINSFSINSQYSGSTLTRIKEYEFFPMLWKSTSNLWGFGFTPDTMGIYNGYTMYRSDIGLPMQLYQFGIIGLVICILPIVVGIYKGLKLIKKEYTFFSSFFLSLSLYLLISNSSFNIYVYILIPLLPIYMGLILANERSLE